MHTCTVMHGQTRISGDISSNSDSNTAAGARGTVPCPAFLVSSICSWPGQRTEVAQKAEGHRPMCCFCKCLYIVEELVISLCRGAIGMASCLERVPCIINLAVFLRFPLVRQEVA